MKIKCRHCGEVIEGDKKGTYITCKCGKLLLMKQNIIGE